MSGPKRSALAVTDMHVLKASCNRVLEHEESIVDRRRLFGDVPLGPLSEALVDESIEVLERHGYVKRLREPERGASRYRVTNLGLWTYLRAFF